MGKGMESFTRRGLVCFSPERFGTLRQTRSTLSHQLTKNGPAPLSTRSAVRTRRGLVCFSPARLGTPRQTNSTLSHQLTKNGPAPLGTRGLRAGRCQAGWLRHRKMKVESRE
jgi:hypothetical protein